MREVLGNRAVVIGAGFGGLSAAIHLARGGAEVTILEKAGTVGGKAGLLTKDRYLFDAGPTLFTMPDLATDTFNAAGILPEQESLFLPLNPICRYVFATGKEFLVSHDVEATQASIARINAEDAAAWKAFLEACREIWRCAGEPYLEAPFDGFLGLFRRVVRRGWKALSIGRSLGTLEAFARDHFESPEMRDFVGHFATYLGGSPKNASAGLAMIAHVELTLGAFYPAGGMYGVAARLEKALERLGVPIRYGTEVTRIEVDARHCVRAVEIKDSAGRRGWIETDYVVANIDPLVVTSRLIPEGRRRAAGAEKLAKRIPSMSAFVWAFGLEGAAPTDVPQTLFFSPDFDGEVRSILEHRRIPDSPTILVSIPSLLDPSRSPPGHHTIFTQLYAPPTADIVDWESEAPRLRGLTLARLRREWGSEFLSRVRAEVVVTPRDIARSGSADGAIYGAAPHGPSAAFARPGNRARGVRGLYFAGGVTHPGGGVTLAMKSGQFAAELLLRDLSRNFPV